MDASDSTNPSGYGFEVVDPRCPDAVASLESYFAELDERFEDDFDPGDTISADAANFEAPEGAFLVMRRQDSDGAFGCGAVQVLDDGAAEIKRMWIAPQARGEGLGKAMLGELETHARQLGNGVIRLDTNNVLSEAIAMYLSQGYVEIEAYNDNPYARHWFEKRAR